MYKFIFALLILLITQSCGPLVGGLGVVAMGSAAKEKGIGTALNDNVINVNILNAIYKWNEKISKDLTINVDNGSVLITGKIQNSANKITLFSEILPASRISLPIFPAIPTPHAPIIFLFFKKK